MLSKSALHKLFGPGTRFSKVPKTFRARKAIRKTATRLFCKAGLFVCCKGIKIKTNAKFRASRRLSFEDAKGTLSPEMHPKSNLALKPYQDNREFKIYDATEAKTSRKIASSSMSIVFVIMSICLTFKDGAY